MEKLQLVKDGIEIVGTMTRNNLGRFGALLDSIEASGKSTSQYKPVNLENIEEGEKEDLFRKKTLEASKQLLGQRFTRYGKYAKKVLPNKFVQQTIDSAFIQVAQLASSWSELDLLNESRFAQIQTLTEHERNALATDIANQNRALATLGSVTGLAGLPGLFADTIWLLLVSLRCVYQIAAVYDMPLSGKQGIKIAYEVLENADLSKMQEKQTLLAGLSVSKGLLNSANSKGLHGELKIMGLKDENIKYFAEQVDKIAGKFNLDFDGIHLGWLVKTIPLFSFSIAAYYNTHLINQVIGVAKATFGPEPKIANQSITSDTSMTDTQTMHDEEGDNELQKDNDLIKSADDDN